MTELQGVTFIDVDTEQSVHTLKDWGLYLRGYPVKSPPQPKWLTTDIPGSNGEINYTKALSGRVSFHVRTLHMELMSATVPEKWDSQYSDVLDFLAGKHVHIIFDSDADYYYDAWTYAVSVTPERTRQIITIETRAYPYKLELHSSLEDWLWDPFNFEDGIVREYKNLTVDGTLELNVVGRRMEVVPSFIVSGTGGLGLTVTYKGNSYQLSDGTNRVVSIDLPEGDNILTFTGSGTVSVDYRGGRL